MGRHRKDGNPLGLEKRVYPHHGQFWYRHRDGRPEPLGRDIAKANERARVYNDPDQRFGTLGYFIDLFIGEARGGRLLKLKSPRTIADYEVHAIPLKAGLGKLSPMDLVERPSLIADYRDARPAKVRANREMSLLSSVYQWLIEKGLCLGLTVNPVLSIQRNPEKPKEKYVDDADYLKVYGLAQRSICMAMELVYKTLQRPADVLRMAPKAVQQKAVAGIATRVLSVRQGKTGRIVNIEATPDLESALLALSAHQDIERLGQVQLSESVTQLRRTIVHATDGAPYSDSGVRAMLRRYCLKAGVQTFGLMDVRAKGATDMYLRGVPLEKIQMLMGHKSVQTTEIYIKRLLALIRIQQPNSRLATGE